MVRSQDLVLPASKYLPETALSPALSEGGDSVYGRYVGEGTALVGVISSLFAAAALGSLVGPLAGSILYEYIAWWLAFFLAAVAAGALAAAALYFREAVQMPADRASNASSVREWLRGINPFRQRHSEEGGSLNDLSSAELSGLVSRPLEVVKGPLAAQDSLQLQQSEQQQQRQQEHQAQAGRLGMAAASASLTLISPRSKLFISPTSASANLTRPFDDTELGGAISSLHSSPRAVSPPSLSPTDTELSPLSPSRLVSQRALVGERARGGRQR